MRGDAFASRVVHPEIQELHAIDFDPLFIQEAQKHKQKDWPVTYHVHDIIDEPYLPNNQKFDAAFSLDAIEHIHPERESEFLMNICKSIHSGGVFICGSPSLESQEYASPASKEGHINCKKGTELKSLLQRYFENRFLFGMNDEVLHTGFSPMCHYNLVIAVGNKYG